MVRNSDGTPIGSMHPRNQTEAQPCSMRLPFRSLLRRYSSNFRLNRWPVRKKSGSLPMLGDKNTSLTSLPQTT